MRDALSEQQDILPPGYAENEPWSGPEHTRRKTRCRDRSERRRHPILLALLIHELTTNAAKYGALSSPSGRVRVAWNVAASRLALEWTEAGGPPAAEPARTGFGSTLLRSGVRQFQGTIERRFDPTGLYCAFSFVIPREPAQTKDEVSDRLPRLHGEAPIKPNVP